ncbi:Dynamin-like protein ARC5 [Morella rubra]|uniref:Dynamin-like protein ARC5 n=1 Tax=Morella rubra TaxID=262757 RepID=A0A6A1V2K4_9ROSI|nr:Dynamin-like protein ARC5 [Morella rubra]
METEESNAAGIQIPNQTEASELEKQGRLYEAYNELHGLAQEFQTPFEAPAVLVVGHQTDGKSALVEALMGFQFNHVGGGTKTRRPITLHMKYDPLCELPRCRLVFDSDSDPTLGVAEEKSLQEIQAYIEAENMRLGLDPCQFSTKEIIIKVEYKYCPNLTIIDTPGLIAPAPGPKNRALQSQARAVESLVRAKMQHKEFIILCLEDCSDWSNATTRRVVMQIDPELSRTVIVSTKLDTKILQFARSSDVEVFLSPPACTLDGFILGDSPFFTSVPSGRVGSGQDSVYRSNDEFKQAISIREEEDIKSLEEKLGRPLSKQERSRIGVSKLRFFLEELLKKRYMDSVPLIIPLLEKEYRSTTRTLDEINRELRSLVQLKNIFLKATCVVGLESFTASIMDEVKLKEKGRAFHDLFLTKLSLLLKGTVVAPPDKFGETLQDERTNGGAFVASDGVQFPHKLIPNGGMRLYGGAQYHRAMAEFRFVVGGTKCPPITREEIVNACGVEDIHDGTNYSRTACVIAVAKARDTFEPFLHQLGGRLLHILKRLLPISVYLLQKDGEYLSGHEVFLRRVATAFNKFAESTERACHEKCMEDLVSTTRYVTWSLHNKNRAGLRQFLDSFGGAEQSTTGSNPLSAGLSHDSSLGSIANEKQDTKPRADVKLSHLGSSTDSASSIQTTETRLADLLDSTLWNRRLAPSSERLVYALVQQIFHGIREYFLASAELKFNCFLLMPVVDKLPALLREDLESAFEDDLDNIFDITNLQHSLGLRKRNTEIELKRKDGEYLSGHEVFLRRVATAFNKFAESTERACHEKCMEDLVSTTRYVTWSLHNKNRAGLRQFLDSFGGAEQSTTGSNPLSAGLSHDSSLGSIANEKQDTKPRADVKLSHLGSSTDSASSIQTTETRLADLLDSTLWNRRLAPSSERLVYALVQQIFHGIREYFLASAELKFNCFLLMPVVDKLPALLREDLESAFEDDLDNIFDITNLQHSLGLRKRNTEIELKRIQRLKVKFRQIHEQLSSHQVMSRPATIL